MTAPTELVPVTDVTGMVPDRQHTTVLGEVDQLVDGYRLAFGGEEMFAGSRAHASIMGRRAILVRHRPQSPLVAGDVSYCMVNGATWPCADYLNAAAGLVDGLPTMDRP